MKLQTLLATLLITFTSNAFEVDQVVVETLRTPSIQKIVAIAENGNIFLTDGNSYRPRHVHAIVKEMDGIRLGVEVLEDHKAATVQKVTAISDNGIFILADGKAYKSRNLHLLQDSLYGIVPGQKVREHYIQRDLINNGVLANSLRSVVAIAKSMFLLDNGKLRSSHEVYPLQDAFYGIKTGACVTETKGFHSVQLVEAVSADYFLLSDSKWYPLSELKRDAKQEKCDQLLEKDEE